MSVSVIWTLKIFSYEESPFQMVGSSREGVYFPLKIKQSWGGSAQDQAVILVGLQVLAKDEPTMDLGLGAVVRCIGPSENSYIGGTYFIPVVFDSSEGYYHVNIRFNRADTYFRIVGVFNPKIFARMTTASIVGSVYVHNDIAERISNNVVNLTVGGQSVPRRRTVYQSTGLRPASVSPDDVYGFFCFITSTEESNANRLMGTPHLHPDYDYPHAQPLHVTDLVSRTWYADTNPWGFPAFIHPTFVYGSGGQIDYTQFTLDSHPDFLAPSSVSVRAGLWLRKDVLIEGNYQAIYCCSPTRDENGYYRTGSAWDTPVTLKNNEEVTIGGYTYNFGGPTSRGGCLFLQKEFLHMGNSTDIVDILSDIPTSLWYVGRATALNLGR